jgi:nitrite reductase (NADH) small subunit
VRRRLGTLEEFPDGRVTVRELEGKSVGVFRDGDDLYGMLNVCPHKGAPVCRGVVTGTMLPSRPSEYEYGMEGHVLRCPWHGWEFDLRTGESPFGVDDRALTMFEVTLEDGDVYADVRARTGQPA